MDWGHGPTRAVRHGNARHARHGRAVP
jgi:hypothetical protein